MTDETPMEKGGDKSRLIKKRIYKYMHDVVYDDL